MIKWTHFVKNRLNTIYLKKLMQCNIKFNILMTVKNDKIIPNRISDNKQDLPIFDILPSLSKNYEITDYI